MATPTPRPPNTCRHNGLPCCQARRRSSRNWCRITTNGGSTIAIPGSRNGTSGSWPESAMDSIVATATPGIGLQGASVVLSDVEKHFDSVGAVRGVSLTVAAGEFLTLLGPSGSGKTTTLMMIAGFETPSRGDITIDGESVVTLPPPRRNIGMVFQNYALFPHLSAADNIGFPLRQRGVVKAEREKLVREALALVQLPGHGERYPGQLSGGQQQRVALARAI